MTSHEHDLGESKEGVGYDRLTNALGAFLSPNIKTKGILCIDSNRFGPVNELLGLLSFIFEVSRMDTIKREIVIISKYTISDDIFSIYAESHGFDDITDRIYVLSFLDGIPKHKLVDLSGGIVILYEINEFIRILNNKILYHRHTLCNEDDYGYDEIRLRKCPSVELYNKLKCEKKCKILIPTDKPVRSSYVDLYLIANLLNDKIFPSNSRSFFATMKNIHLVMKSLEGYVWHNHETKTHERPFKTISKNSIVDMSYPQYELYKERVAREADMRVSVLGTNRRIPYASISMAVSQSVCNYVYMDERDKYAIEPGPWGKDDTSGSSVTKDSFSMLRILSTKFRNILVNIISNNGNHLVYSKFSDIKGIRLLHSLLDYAKMNPILYDGTKECLLDFNNNIEGKMTYVLLMSDDAFMRGTSSDFREFPQFKCVSYLHMLEPTVDYTKLSTILDYMIDHAAYSLRARNTKNKEVIRIIHHISRLPYNINEVVVYGSGSNFDLDDSLLEDEGDIPVCERIRIKKEGDDTLYINQSKSTDEIIYGKSIRASNISNIMNTALHKAARAYDSAIH